jgi:hypothetical protein
MPSIWLLRGEADKAMNEGNWTFEQLRASGMRLSFRNLATDTLTWSQHLASLSSTSEIIPELGQVVELYRNGIKFFRGHVTGSRQVGRRVDTTVSGPWWWLENEYLQTPQKDATGALAQRPSFAFGVQPLKTSLRQLLNAAKYIGIPIEVGILADTYTAPQLRMNLSSYAQSISEIIRMTPDMVLYWDYSGTLPQANTVRRLNGIYGTAVPLTLDARQCKDFELTPLTALQVTQVMAPFMQVNVANQYQYSSQAAGTSALGKVALYTVSGGELGADALKTVSEVATVIGTPTQAQFTLGVTVNSTFDFIHRDADFIKAAAQFGPDELGRWNEEPDDEVLYFRIGGPHGTYKARVPKGVRQRIVKDKPGGGSTNAWQDSTYLPGINNLFLGDMPDWLATQLGAYRVEYFGTIHRLLICRNFDEVKKYDITPEDPYHSPSAKFLMQGVEVNKGFLTDIAGNKAAGHCWVKRGTKYKGAFWMARYVGWSGWLLPNAVLTPTIYTRDSIIIPTISTTTTPNTGFRDGFRAPPEGFAQGMLESQNYLPYGGKASIVEDQCGSQRYMARCLNFSNSQPKHASIYAMVTEETLDLGTGITTIYLGPPARFNFDDLVSRIRPEPNAQIVQG